MPISCSMKKLTALARSAHEPPKLTTPSTRRAPAARVARAAPARGTAPRRRWSASARPVAARTRSPSSESCRPSVVTSMTRAARASQQARERGDWRRSDLLRVAGVGGGSGRRRHQRTGSNSSAASDPWAGRPVRDVPLGAEGSTEHVVGHRRKSRSRRSGCGGPAIEDRLRPVKSADVDPVGDDLGRLAEVGWAEKSGARALGRRVPHRLGALDQLGPVDRVLEDLLDADEVRGPPPTRCTWMWSGWP